MRGRHVRPTAIDPARFISDNLRLLPVPAIPEIRLYLAHPGSGLRRLAESGPGARQSGPPYWAYPWAGGLALARYILDQPGAVADLRVLDLGAGSGLVAIAAALAGARQVFAAEIDPHGRTAIALNAEANGFEIVGIGDDLTRGPAPDVDLVLVGDLFYDRDTAERVTEFLERCRAAGLGVLVGDPGRAHLPRQRLRLMATYDLPDFGEANTGKGQSAVFAFEAAIAPAV